MRSDRAAKTGDTEMSRFVNDLLSRMTFEEKIGQMSQIALNEPQEVSPDQLILKGQVGSFLFITDANEINRLQHIAVDRSRLHIPLIFGFDVIHGFRTIYPVPLALSASWDPTMVEHVQSMAAKEASAVGVDWTFAPMVDIARDPRWGRIMEGAGEDPYLGSKMAAAQVRGFQGDTLGSPNHILACVKHFAGYGAAEGGRDYDSSDISDEQLWNVYLPPFEAAVHAGAGSLMPAYMDLNGVPAAGNKFLLQDVLRDKWKFDGFVVSDWDAVFNLTTHGFASGPEDAAARAVNAGVDMEMTSHVYRDNLAKAVKDGLVKQSTIDESVRRILTTKYRLGLFSHPYSDPSQVAAQLVSPEQRDAARKAAERTAVLLRNEGGLLPLSKSLKSIAVIGPLADSKPDIMGSWSLAGHPADAVTVLEGIRKRFGADATVSWAKGVEIARGQPSIFDSQFPSPQPTLTTDAARDAEFAHAIDLIKQSQVAVLVLGEAQNMSGEAASRSTLTLPGRQEQLLEAAVATGKPIVLVLLNGRPLNITWASQHVPAILDAWYPGTEGGNAIADLLFGDANPGGKLPVSWPRSVGQVPIFYAHNNTQNTDAHDTRYWDGSSAPLYPFGYGLSYTSFKLDDLKLASSTVKSGSSLMVSINVQNTGSVAGDEVVQLYTHQRSGSSSRPVRELKGFRRITLKRGDKQTITLQLDTRDLGFWSPQTHHWSIEPGTFDLWVGTDSTATNHATFTVLPQ
ncbi:beta-glucosidase BglX [Edaphobacter paludis]|uniref:Periplasmic beta-glucosidase n=1 Tax=Edaphobacter paludis TaxID=3035702 RepID=A0AAU7D0X9_9BACT